LPQRLRADGSGDVERDAVKFTAFCVLAIFLSMAAHGGISDALGATGPQLPQTPVPPSRAATPPSLDTPPGGPRNPNPTPMPAPAPTNHYAGSAGDLK